MLFQAKFLPGLKDGSITAAFRLWRRPTVKPGGTLQTAAGQLAIETVDPIDFADVTEADLRRAGFGSYEELRASLGSRPGQLYRIRFHRQGDDPRIALRNSAALNEQTLADIRTRLSRLDRASPTGPWTHTTLSLIAHRPATRAAELARQSGQATLAFKTSVRKLKALGLTESLETGYRLSPRGEAFLKAAPEPSR